MKKYTFEDIKARDLLIYNYIRGSHAYGLQKSDGSSDIDTAGVFIEPMEWILGLGLDFEDQIQDERHDNVWYSLKKFMNMLLSSNPTVLESLFIPERCVLYEHPIMTEIKKHRDKFITKACFKPFLGYAYEQIKKCRSLNKLFVNPVDERKEPLDFVYTFYNQGSSNIKNWLEYRGLKQQYCGLVNIPNMHDVYGCYYDWGNFFLNEGIDIFTLGIIFQKDDAYNEKFVDEFYTNRDPRFHATFFCPGTSYPCPDRLPNGMNFWNAWKLMDGLYVTMIQDELNTGYPQGTNFFQRKGLDELGTSEVYNRKK